MSVTSFGRNQLSLQARQGEFLTESEMRARLPAIFADHAHDSRSDRYAFIPTIDILRGLAREGFRPVSACQAKARDADMHGYTKHMLRFRRSHDVAKLGVDFPEVVAVNSHGGQSQYHLMSGVFRLICTNGMITSDTLGEIKVRHTGNIVDEVIEGTYKIVEQFPATMNAVSEMKAITLRPAEQLALAESAAVLRLDTDEGERPAIAAEQFNRARRADDRSADLWTTFNRVQENVIRGGLHGSTIGSDGRRRRMTTREVHGIDQSVTLNRALWTLAERMEAIKAAG